MQQELQSSLVRHRLALSILFATAVFIFSVLFMLGRI